MKVRNEATLKDGLYYLSADYQDVPLERALGQINGILTGFMAATGCSIESACSAVYAYLPKYVRVVRIPTPYRRFFGIYEDDPGDLDYVEHPSVVWDTVHHKTDEWNEDANKPESTMTRVEKAIAASGRMCCSPDED